MGARIALLLPPEAVQRQDCWYGYGCRTQHHNEEHARKRNHVCRPTRDSEDMDSRSNLSKINLDGEDICLVDSGTTNTILRSNKYFIDLQEYKAKINTISGSTNLIDGSGRANIILPEGTKLEISDALYSPKSLRNLLSFKDIRRNGYHLETISEDNREYLCITSSDMSQKHVIEKLAAISSGLYLTTIKAIESYSVINPKFNDPITFKLWHNRLGHPGSTMMGRIIQNSRGHHLQNQKLLLTKDINCVACSIGKLILKPSLTKWGELKPPEERSKISCP
ncbi:hypothetical protein OROMI_023951 [Orobanche minor]